MIRPGSALLLALALALVAALATQCARIIDAVDQAGAAEGGAGIDGTSSGTDSTSPISDAGSPNADAPGQDGAPATLDGGPSLVWPPGAADAGGSPNGDPGLVTNHDKIAQLLPRVMVLDYYNGQPGVPLLKADAISFVNGRIKAVAESSRYHGYADSNAPAVLNYQLSANAFIDLTDNPRPDASAYESSSLLPLGDGGAFDLSQLFTQAYAVNYQVQDPTGASPYLKLCQLFEQGYINELWLMTGDEANPRRRPPLFLERKQAYDAQNRPLPGVFVSTGVTPWPDNPITHCNVTTRIAYVSTANGVPCDLISYSIGIENMALTTDAGVAIQYLAQNGADFFNSDFRARYGAPFNSWLELVNLGPSGSGWCTNSLSPCISYPSDTVVQGTATPEGGIPAWTISQFHQGCGTAHFPPNATYEYDWNNTTAVASRCEHYNLQDGPDGGDSISRYSFNDPYVVTFTQTYQETKCGGGWQFYLRQNMPGLNNMARASDGSRMKNWWPFLFY